MCDILLRNGLVVDGNGGAPYVADVAITGDKISAVGKDLAVNAARTVDATGHIVTPGFVDIHTHYDGQITWDPMCTPSSQHGVTTILFGNCGIGFAPCKPQDRGNLIDYLESVEDIPGVAITEGIKWSWETYPEYVDSLSKINAACDFMTMIGHVPLRVYVMGERANEPPNAEDLKEMKKIVKEAMEAGAAGFSTSRTLLHRDKHGAMIPGTYADREELTVLMAGMAEGGGGIFEELGDFAGVEEELDWIGKLSKAFGIPVSFAIDHATCDEAKQNAIQSWLEEVNKDGETITAQVAIKQEGCLQSLHAKYHPFVGHPTFRTKLSDLPYDEMIQQMRKPEVKAQILSEKSFMGHRPFYQIVFDTANLFKLCDAQGTPRYEQSASTQSFAELAKQAGIADPLDPIYDALVAGEVLWSPFAKKTSLDRPLDLLSHPHFKIGLGDGGAHLGIFQEASWPTFVLSHYARDRTAGAGAIPLEVAVKHQTKDTASVVGLKDRGVVEAGKRADINVIDYNKLRLKSPYMAADLPMGYKRWMQDAEGYRMTICAGAVTYEYDKPTGVLPGRLIRNPLKGQLNVKAMSEVDAAAIAGPEPKSTQDKIVSDVDLTGKASATARALRENLKMMDEMGDFFSGRMLDEVDQKLISANPTSSEPRSKL